MFSSFSTAISVLFMCLSWLLRFIRLKERLYKLWTVASHLNKGIDSPSKINPLTIPHDENVESFLWLPKNKNGFKYVDSRPFCFKFIFWWGISLNRGSSKEAKVACSRSLREAIFCEDVGSESNSFLVCLSPFELEELSHSIFSYFGHPQNFC